MAEPRRVDVEILGQRYAIRSEAPPDYVRQLVAYVEKRVQEVRGDAPGQDTTKVLVLTALDLTDELFRLREEQGKGDIDITARLGQLIKLLDAVVPPSR
ncbi:MAG TPA: cell division protein ZapA [Verrucomicrobiae bacterium]|jgi:cell division protein ZapA|nr:cell division protein ZapA [Verrucomicrobiae bacterium]